MVNFNCTMCGKCCNRSPEVELTETLSLASDFVFWLSFSLSEIPLSIEDWKKTLGRREFDQRDLAAFIAKRRLLEEQSVIRFAGRSDSFGETKRVRKYVRISALALDLEFGRCEKLVNRRCTIYERRPHTCKTVPFHYQLTDWQLGTAFSEFTSIDNFECDTSEHAPVILQDGRIASECLALERAAGQATVRKDAPWRGHIAQRIVQGTDRTGALPSLENIKASSRLKVILVPIYVAWQVGLETGIVNEVLYRESIEKQTELIKALLRRDMAGQFLAIDVKSRRQLTDLLADYSSIKGLPTVA